MAQAAGEITITPRALARFLGITAFILVLCSVAGQIWLYKIGPWHRIIRVFNVDAEANVPTYYSTMLLTFTALILAVIAVLVRRQKAAFGPHWWVLSLGFVALAIEETASLHERFIEPIREMMGGGNLGLFHYAWVIPGIALVAVLIVGFWKFLMHLPRVTRNRVMLAGAIYVGGAVGFEMLGGAYSEGHGERNLTYNMINTVEESMEMGGVIFFIWALTSYLRDTYGAITFGWGAPSPTVKEG